MVTITFFLILLFSGFQLYALWPEKVLVFSPEALRQLFFLYVFAILIVKMPKIQLKKDERPILVYFLFLLAFLFVNMLRSPAMYNGIIDLVKLIYVFLTFIIVMQLISIHGVVTTKNLMRKYLFIVSLLFLLQIVLYTITGYYVSADTGELSIGMKNTLAVGAMFSSILALFFYNNFLKGRTLIDLLAFLTFFVVTFISFTRIAILGLLAGFFFLTLLYRRYRFVLLAAVVLTPVLLIFGESLIAETFKGYVHGFQEIVSLKPGEILQAIELRGRGTFWPIALKSFLKHPLVGNGLGYSNYMIKAKTGYYEQVHNDYLKLLADTGIIGLFLYLALFFLMLYHAFKLYRLDIGIKSDFAFFVCTVIQILIFSFTDNVISYAPYLVIYVFIAYTLLVRSCSDLYS